MKSIRKGLTLRLVVGLAVIYAALAGTGSLLVRKELREFFDESLERQVRAYASLVQQESAGLDLEFSSITWTEHSPGHDREYLLLVDEAGKVLYQSPGPAVAPVLLRASADSPVRFYDVVLPGGMRARAVRFSFRPVFDEEPSVTPGAPGLRPVGPLTLHFARETTEQQLLFARLRALVLGASVLALVLSVLLVRVIVRRGLRPIARMADKAHRIDESRLGERFPVSSVPRELRPIASRLNTLLRRLDRAFQRERRFIDNVAHELLTPIAELRSSVSVARRWHDDPALVQRSLEDIDDAAAQQERLIRVLLSITRADSGRHRLDLERLDLATLLADIVAARAGEGSRPVDVRVRHSVPLHVLADRAVLTSILDNLIRNACEYAPADSTPVIRLGATPRAAFVSVSNLAPTLAAEDAALLFDPFWRKDPSHAPGAHLGLGLSLARSFADLLGARIDARLDPGGVLTLRLRLPVEGGG